MERALAHLRLEPLLDLGTRLGDGTGAVAALPLLRTAAHLLTDTATDPAYTSSATSATTSTTTSTTTAATS